MRRHSDPLLWKLPGVPGNFRENLERLFIFRIEKLDLHPASIHTWGLIMEQKVCTRSCTAMASQCLNLPKESNNAFAHFLVLSFVGFSISITFHCRCHLSTVLVSDDQEVEIGLAPPFKPLAEAEEPSKMCGPALFRKGRGDTNLQKSSKIMGEIPPWLRKIPN